MKKIYISIALILCSLVSFAQQKGTNVNFDLGKGLNLNFNRGLHNFNMGGYLMMNAIYSKTEDLQDEFGFNVNRALYSMSGSFYNEKLSFMLQLDFTKNFPLYDAWFGYKPCDMFKVSFGQKQSFSGPRSMMIADQNLAFNTRCVSNRTFFDTGREFGLFLESRLPLKSAGLDLGAAVTSGDGRNSFGSSSSDTDLGKLKYTGRLTFYPLGFFAKDNEFSVSDFAREKTVKMGVGVTYSYNNGVSNKIGEGHGDFKMYDKDGNAAYPDYQKFCADLLLKYRGFSFLAEYTNATGNGLDGLFTEAVPTGALKPKEIANYLVLGNGYNIQAGYVFRNSWAIDAMFSCVRPEWEENKSLIEKVNEYTFGVSKYFVNNAIKLQMFGSYQDMPDLFTQSNTYKVGFNASIIF